MLYIAIILKFRQIVDRLEKNNLVSSGIDDFVVLFAVSMLTGCLATTTVVPGKE